ncbi:MAG: substrate-binding domain-containing protein [Thermoguttaceae bacterium]|jgi:LacI family transcriptional regulator
MTTFVRGIMDYANRHGGWVLTTSPPSLIGAGEKALTLEALRGWKGDGAIAAILNERDIEAARQLHFPVLNNASTFRETGFPRVRPDHYAMGRLAAEHLLDRGLRRLAYYGVEGYWFNELRFAGFADCAKRANVPCIALNVPRSCKYLQQRIDMLARWLKRLHPPVGILGVQDYRARAVIEECQNLRLRIPHDVAVIGMEDDPTLCEFCQPTLSSVSRDPWAMGMVSAEMLDRLMNGLNTPNDVAVPPDGVVARQSTDTIAVEDPHLADALHFIHDNIQKCFGIDQVVRATAISRRQLETRFRDMLGCSPHEYLCRKRVERVKHFLSVPERIKFHKLSRDCGFPNVERMRLVFKRVTGMTPVEFRQRQMAQTKPSGEQQSQRTQGCGKTG